MLRRLRDMEVVRACVQPLMPRRYMRPRVALIAASRGGRGVRAIRRELDLDTEQFVSRSLEVIHLVDDDVRAASTSRSVVLPHSLQDETSEGHPPPAVDWLRSAIASVGRVDALHLYVEDADSFDGGVLNVGATRVAAGDIVALANACGAYSIGLTACGVATLPTLCRAAATIALQRGGPVFATARGIHRGPERTTAEGAVAAYHTAAVYSDADHFAGQRAVRMLLERPGVSYGHPTASVTAPHALLASLWRVFNDSAAVRAVAEDREKQDAFTRRALDILRRAASLPFIGRRHDGASRLGEGWYDSMYALAHEARALTSERTPSVPLGLSTANLAMAAARHTASAADSSIMMSLIALHEAAKGVETDD